MKKGKILVLLCLVLTVVTAGVTSARYATAVSDKFDLHIIAERYNLTLDADHGFFDNDETKIIKTLSQISNQNFGVHNSVQRTETIDGADKGATYQFLGWTSDKDAVPYQIDFAPDAEIIVTQKDTTLWALWLRKGPATDAVLGNIYEPGKTTELEIPGMVQSPDGGTWYEVTELPTGIFGYIYDEDTTVTSVVIPDTVTTIGYGVFGRFSAMETVVIPDSVTEIGERAFHFCTSLKELNLPANLKTIDNHAFVNCSALTSVVIPDGVTHIGDYSFSQCHALETMYVPSTVTYIGRGAIYQAGQNIGGIKVIYDGTMEQWNTICSGDIGAGNSQYMIQCTDGNIVGKNYAGS